MPIFIVYKNDKDKRLKAMKKFSLITMVLFLLIAAINAQDRNEVVNAYNEGAKTAQTDAKAAIASFENVVALSEKVGESVNDLKDKAIQVLPGLYVKVASDALNQKKPAAEIIEAAKAAQEAADKYNNPTHKENAGKLLVQGYYRQGADLFTAKEYDQALAAFDNLLEVNPDFAIAYYNKALVYRAQNNVEAFEQAIDAFIERSGTDEKRMQQASQLALEYFRALGSQANQAGNLDEALNYLGKGEKYGQDKDLFYYFADVYNKQKNFDKGASYAQQGLDLETGTADSKAKFYFQLGLAQEGKGDIAAACASFKNSMYGPFAEPSKVQRTNLKCQ
jgi:tetratricopeptide (TPR) repeat protein